MVTPETVGLGFRRGWRWLVVGLAAACALGCGASDAGPGASSTAAECPTGPLEWYDCYGPLRCADLELPVDYEDGSLGTVKVVIGGSLADPAKRRGTVFVHFGGPGRGLTSMAGSPGMRVDFAEVFEQYDVLTMDPRGLGDSTPLECGETVDLDAYTSLSLDLADDQAWAALKAHTESVASACNANLDPTLRARIDSDAVTRDMECARQALGDEQLSFLGASYGTRIGSKYATMFPDRVGAFVLDSVAGLPADTLTNVRRVALASEAGLGRFFEAVGGDAASPFHGGEGAAAVRAAFDQLHAGRRGVASTATDVGELGFLFAAHDYLWKGDFSGLASALHDAETGDFSGLRGIARRSVRSTYMLDVFSLDFGCPDLTEEELRATLIQLSTDAPHFGALQARDDPGCLTSNLERAHADIPVSAHAAPPMLLIVSPNDMLTPGQYATETIDALGNSSHVMTYNGEGHVYYNRDECVSDAIGAFLADPSSPPAWTCP